MNTNLKIKVCGMKNMENIHAVLLLEPDYIGFIFYPKSVRFMDKALPKNLTFGNTKKTGVFVNENMETILKTANKYSLDAIQLHGNETPEMCEKIKTYKYQVIKVFSVDDDFNFNNCKAYNNVCDLFLFDTKGKLHGGNGVTFNWKKLEEYTLEKSFLLSGGISLEHTQELIKIKHKKLLGVDINSKFENNKGLKNIKQLNSFFYEVRNR